MWKTTNVVRKAKDMDDTLMREHEQARLMAKERLQCGLACPTSACYLGMCCLRGHGVPRDARMAGWYFRMGADMLCNGALMDHRDADLCRMEILKDSLRRNQRFDTTDHDRLIQYCDVILRHGRYAVRTKLIRCFLLRRKG